MTHLKLSMICDPKNHMPHGLLWIQKNLSASILLLHCCQWSGKPLKKRKATWKADWGGPGSNHRADHPLGQCWQHFDQWWISLFHSTGGKVLHDLPWFEPVGSKWRKICISCGPQIPHFSSHHPAGKVPQSKVEHMLERWRLCRALEQVSS